MSYRRGTWRTWNAALYKNLIDTSSSRCVVPALSGHSFVEPGHLSAAFPHWIHRQLACVPGRLQDLSAAVMLSHLLPPPPLPTPPGVCRHNTPSGDVLTRRSDRAKVSPGRQASGGPWSLLCLNPLYPCPLDPLPCWCVEGRGTP